MSTTATPKGASSLRAGDRSATPVAPSGKIAAIAGWLDNRTGLAKPVRYGMKKVFPDHWSFMLGEVAMYSMAIALLTGVILSLWLACRALDTWPTTGHSCPCRASTCPRRTSRPSISPLRSRAVC